MTIVAETRTRAKRASVLSAALLAAGLLASWPAARADAQPRFVDRCVAGSAESRRAMAALDAWGGALRSATDPTAVVALSAELAQMREQPCFASLQEMREGWPSGRSLAAMRAWWDAGGYDWLRHHASGRARGDAAYEIVLPPSEPEVLDRDRLAPDAPERAWVCSATDAACGRETDGWTLRAQRAFEAHARRLREEAAVRAPSGGADAADCARRARAVANEEHRYIAWLDCVQGRRARLSTMPIGRSRAITRGWLVLRGRRGHRGECASLVAYDLATGSAFGAHACDGARTRGEGDPTSSRRVESGRVSIENLREAAWMLSSLRAIGAARPIGTTRVRVPEGISTRWRTDAPRSFSFADDVVSSEQTELSWSVQDGGRTLASGSLTWPYASDAARDHAALLVRVVEAGLVPGCTAAALPAGLDLGPASAHADEAALAPALRSVRPRRCR